MKNQIYINNLSSVQAPALKRGERKSGDKGYRDFIDVKLAIDVIQLLLNSAKLEDKDLDIESFKKAFLLYVSYYNNRIQSEGPLKATKVIKELYNYAKLSVLGGQPTPIPFMKVIGK